VYGAIDYPPCDAGRGGPRSVRALGQAEGMDDAVQWLNANITWSREQGYTLRLPLWADSRALSIRENKLIQSIQLAMSDRTETTIEIVPMVVERSSSSANAEPGEIAISTETMVNLSEAMRLREAISGALYGVVEEVERVRAEDEASAKTVLARLREPSPGS
jgi:hypothetical protein